MEKLNKNYDKGVYTKYLNQALDALFRPTKDNGFWDEKEGRIIRGLNYKINNKGGISWSIDNSIEWRFPPFAIMGVMQWRDSEISSDIYDFKIKSNLDHFINKIQNEHTLSQIPSYGIGPLIISFSLASKVFSEEVYKKIAFDLYNFSLKKFKFDNSEDCFLLYSWCFLYEIDKNNFNIKNNIEKYLEEIIKKQDDEGLFIFKNRITTSRHQNQMYALWAVSKAIEVLNKKEHLIKVEKTIDYSIDHRMLDNGAFLWYNKVPLIMKLLVLFGLKKSTWEFLYECHQTFFVNSVFQYYSAGGDKDYNKYVKKAMDWIFYGNILNKNLVEMSGIGVPMRMMTLKGKMDVNGQMFKGTYEIGSYIMALKNFELLINN